MTELTYRNFFRPFQKNFDLWSKDHQKNKPRS